jgi:hypothetical protein
MIEHRIVKTQTQNQRKTLDPVTAVAIVWSSIFMPNTHGINGGTNADQIKLLMKQGYERHGVIDFTPAELVKLWNQNSHGKTRTIKQVASALQALKSKGHVTITEKGGYAVGSKGPQPSRYALISVIEKETAPPVEENKINSPSDIPGTDDFPGTEVSPKSEIGSLTGKLNTLTKIVEKNYAVIANSYTEHTQAINSSREAYNKLVATIQDLINFNSITANANGEEFIKFSKQTNSNFQELQEQYIKILDVLSSKINTLATTSSSPKEIMDAYREGYKAGFKDGRNDYRDDLLQNSSTKAIEDRG